MAQVELKNLIKELFEEFKHWQDIYKNGCSDPFWADGTNLNLIRNHILYYKGQINDLCEANNFELPKEYFRPVPDEVPNYYMAKPDDIRKNANEAYEVYYSTDVFERCRDAAKTLKKEYQEIAMNISNYKFGCKQYIEQDDLIGMRRYIPERAREDIKIAEEFLKRKDIWKDKAPANAFTQISLFNLLKEV